MSDEHPRPWELIGEFAGRPPEPVEISVEEPDGDPGAEELPSDRQTDPPPPPVISTLLRFAFMA